MRLITSFLACLVHAGPTQKQFLDFWKETDVFALQIQDVLVSGRRFDINYDKLRKATEYYQSEGVCHSQFTNPSYEEIAVTTFDEQLNVAANVENFVEMIENWIESYVCAQEKAKINGFRRILLRMRSIGTKYDEYEPTEYRFHISEEKLDFNEALAYCYLQNMWLADPDENGDEAPIIFQMMDKSLDGQQRYWFDNDGENCQAVRTANAIYTFSCDTKLHAVCMRGQYVTTTTTTTSTTPTGEPCTNTFSRASPHVVFVKMDHPAATQDEAEQVCVDNLGHLAFFKNEAEFNEYLKETSDNKEWLGIKKTEQGYINADGSEPFLKWVPGEPNNEDGDEDCVEMWNFADPPAMNDENCGLKRAFRCRIETYLDDDEKLRVCLNNPAAEECEPTRLRRSCISAEEEYVLSLDVRCAGTDGEDRGVANLRRPGDDSYFTVGSVGGYPNYLFFWMRNPNGPDAVGLELLTDEGTQWWQNTNNPTYVFPCSAGVWNKVIVNQFYNSDTNEWIKTLNINGEDRFRFTSSEPDQGTLTAYDGRDGEFSKNQIRDFRIGQIEFTEVVQSKNAFEAELRCRKQGGHIAFFQTRTEFDQYMINGRGNVPSLAWLGIQRQGDSDTFRNVDGTTPFLIWHDGEPNDVGGQENCVSMRLLSGVRKMNDVACDRDYSYICRIDSNPECGDIEIGCDRLSSMCETSGFTRMFCPKTCGLCDTWKPERIGDLSYLDNFDSMNCEDTNEWCSSWASQEQCMVNPNYMLKHCPVSCKQCEPLPHVVFVKMDHPAATQDEAEQVCVDNLGHLAFFKNEAEFNEYLKETSENNEWLGIKKSGEGYINADGSEPFLKWYPGEPNNDGGDEECVEMWNWADPPAMNDENCLKKRAFRCRIETYLDDDDKQRARFNNPAAEEYEEARELENNTMESIILPDMFP